jgi:carbonic anhydrase/acetyltransferase-like protein (isoleucine patch superfamily)
LEYDAGMVDSLPPPWLVRSALNSPARSNVYFAPGAKVFGKITVGHYAEIGANAVIYPDIPNMAVSP